MAREKSSVEKAHETVNALYDGLRNLKDNHSIFGGRTFAAAVTASAHLKQISTTLSQKQGDEKQNAQPAKKSASFFSAVPEASNNLKDKLIKDHQTAIKNVNGSVAKLNELKNSAQPQESKNVENIVLNAVTETNKLRMLLVQAQLHYITHAKKASAALEELIDNTSTLIVNALPEIKENLKTLQADENMRRIGKINNIINTRDDSQRSTIPITLMTDDSFHMQIAHYWGSKQFADISYKPAEQQPQPQAVSQPKTPASSLPKLTPGGGINN